MSCLELKEEYEKSVRLLKGLEATGRKTNYDITAQIESLLGLNV